MIILFITETCGKSAQGIKRHLGKLHFNRATNAPHEDAVYDLANKYILVR